MDRDSDSGSSTLNRPASTRTSCDLCKRLKIKCERQGKSCLHCIDRGSKCEITLVERKKRQTNREVSLLDIESRIKRMESVITASVLGGQQHTAGDTAISPGNLTPAGPSALTDRLATLIINGAGNSQFFGASFGLSLFSPQGLQWISDRTGSNRLSQFISGLIRSIDTPKHVDHAKIWRTTASYEPLPLKETADHYVHAFFRYMNSIFPLYDQADFNEKYDQQYSGKPPNGPAWYASLNVVLCLGSLICHGYSQEKDTHSHELHWKYFHNASSCLVDLLFEDCGLLAVQALCGMAFIQEINMEPQSIHVLIVAAARLAYGIGLHRNLKGFGLSQAEIDQRQNVFWVVYFMEKSVALRLGLPSVINDDDIGIDMPREKNITEVQFDGSAKYDIFRCQTQLAMLAGRIYSELYSARSQRNSGLERLRSVGELDKALLEWKEALPLEIQPEKGISCDESQLIPITIMHFLYFSCLTSIHRVSVHHGSWTSSHLDEGKSALHNEQLNPRVYTSQTICLSAARHSIQMLQSMNFRESPLSKNVMWVLPLYPLSGLMTLFANCLQNPLDSYVYEDLKLIDHVTSLLSPTTVYASSIPVVATLIFRELGDVARTFVERTNSKFTKTKRTYDESSSEQDVRQAQPYDQSNSSKTADAFPQPTIDFRTSDSMISTANTTYHDKKFTTNPLNLPPTNNQQYNLAPPNFSEAGAVSNPSLCPNIGLRQSNFSSNPLVLSECFEWDLANLWNMDITPGL